MVNCDAENNQNNGDQESQYANLSSTSTLDLHTPTALQVPEEHLQPVKEHNEEFNEILCTELPGSLPEFTPVNISQTIVWSQSSENVITVNSSEIDKAYDEITT